MHKNMFHASIPATLPYNICFFKMLRGIQDFAVFYSLYIYIYIYIFLQAPCEAYLCQLWG